MDGLKQTLAQKMEGKYWAASKLDVTPLKEHQILNNFVVDNFFVGPIFECQKVA